MTPSEAREYLMQQPHEDVVDAYLAALQELHEERRGGYHRTAPGSAGRMRKADIGGFRRITQDLGGAASRLDPTSVEKTRPVESVRS